MREIPLIKTTRNLEIKNQLKSIEKLNANLTKTSR